ncbi:MULTISPECIES: hypothetical protein [unclassified Actinobaculum]|uniref:hypothetical protein n=1 Tax=unclassified Actinobaculum TaxID=2609299 RepID=UPI000D5276F0|nr:MULTISPECIES: hypothetical protein [unclassified Actinobaculum]AWE41530.1 hypothetical protein DDD63_00675 [Actinobaculum sp. 313]RTE48037.1 hypothetical protein EKN07_11230 [Actinobaculum sp. 352]
MSEWSFETQMQAIEALSSACANWMRSARVEEVSIELQAVGKRIAAQTRALRSSRLLRRGGWEENTVPREIIEHAAQVRVAMARPGGGAWTKGLFTMNKRDYQLSSDFDYDHEPILNPPYTSQDVADELQFFPRDPRATPEWMLQNR